MISYVMNKLMRQLQLTMKTMIFEKRIGKLRFVQWNLKISFSKVKDIKEKATYNTCGKKVCNFFFK